VPVICPSCQAADTLAFVTDEYQSRKLACSGCGRYLYVAADTTLARALTWAQEAWRYAQGKCPTCPAEPLKARRSRCPICKEWITYTPDHPGHKLFSRGRWTKPGFKPAHLAWLGHMNANRATHTGQRFVETFYEPAAPQHSEGGD
jgi:hypothetical protein